jgi:hypothetical protein
MNRLTTSKRTQVISALVEGNSIRATVRMTDAIQRLLASLDMRMQMRRFTRLTNTFSKKVQNLGYAVGLHFMHYNFCRVHQTLRVTPAMEAGIADHIWTIEEVVGLLRKSVQNAA